MAINLFWNSYGIIKKKDALILFYQNLNIFYYNSFHLYSILDTTKTCEGMSYTIACMCMYRKC